MEFILICSLRSQLSAGPLHFINHISFLFENEKWNWWLIEMKGQRPKRMYWMKWKHSRGGRAAPTKSTTTINHQSTFMKLNWFDWLVDWLISFGEEWAAAIKEINQSINHQWNWMIWFDLIWFIWIALPPGPAPPANKPIQSPIKSIFNLFDGIEWLFWRQAPPQEQQQIKKLYFLIWLDCSLGAASAAANHKSPISPFGRADWCDLLVLLMACGVASSIQVQLIYLISSVPFLHQ